MLNETEELDWDKNNLAREEVILNANQIPNLFRKLRE